MLGRLARRALIRATHTILRDPTVQTALWDIMHRRGSSERKAPVVINPWQELWRRAGTASVEYIEERMLTVPALNDRERLFEMALDKVILDGLYLEFGTGWKAESIDFLAQRVPGLIHGFDAFQGLPEAWFGELGKGSFTNHGRLPKVRDNVRLHVGWFDQTLPAFLAEHPGDVAFLHIDCDVYSSTRTVFEQLAERIRPGTVIQFDEYFNYPGWQKHEFKAFQEFVTASGLSYEYLGYSTLFAVAVRMTSGSAGDHDQRDAGDHQATGGEVAEQPALGKQQVSVEDAEQ